MYSTAFWCLFAVLLVFFLALLRNHCYSFHSQRSKLFITIQFIPSKRLRCVPPNFVILPAANKQGFPRYYRILIM